MIVIVLDKFFVYLQIKSYYDRLRSATRNEDRRAAVRDLTTVSKVRIKFLEF